MIEHFAVTWLVNAIWIVPLIALATALCSRFGRLGPRALHAAWMTALVLAVSLPAFPAAMPSLRFAPGTWSRTAVSPAIAPAPSGVTETRAEASAPPTDSLPLLAIDQAWTRAILSLVVGIEAIALCRLLVAIRAGRRLVRAARTCNLDSDVRPALARGTRTAPPILESQAISSPVVVGAVRPTILVPPFFTSLPWDEQRAALLHEMAHVARRDYAWNLVCEAVSLPLAWHPAILPIKAGVRRSREAACDAMAADAMASRVTYAKCLVSLASRLGPAQPTSAVVVGLIGKSDLEERLMNLLSPKPGRVSASLRAAGAVAIASTVLLPAVLLRVTPAFADEPVVARRLLAPAPAASVEPVSPAAHAVPVAARAAPRRVASVQRMASSEAATPIQPPSPPAPPAPPKFAEPAPPPPPAEIRYHIGHGRYDLVVHRAVEQALSAEKVMETDAMRRAMAEIRASQAELTRTEQARIHAEVETAMAELDHAHLKETLDKLRSQLRSPEFRNAIAEAARQAATAAAAEAQAGDGKD